MARQAEPLWRLSAHSLLPRSRWEAIRRTVLEELGLRCSSCGTAIERGATCHEQWAYEEKSGVARLHGLTIICRPCNGVHHAGRASFAGRRGAVLAQLAEVNSVEPAKAHAVLRTAMNEWRRRSSRSWTIVVAPELLARFPDLLVLDGLSGTPGDGRQRLRESGRPGKRQLNG